MTVDPALLSRAPSGEGFVPPSGDLRVLDTHGYDQEEWFATGEATGHTYTTPIYVRRPRDASRFTGTVIVEPIHGTSYVPIWAYTNKYILEAGHAWVGVCSLKSVLDGHIKPAYPDRYRATQIWSDEPALREQMTVTGGSRDAAAMQARREKMRRLDVLSTPILAQIGAALARAPAVFAELDVRHLVLAGHSHTGAVVSDFVRDGHDTYRHSDGTALYRGFFPIRYAISALRTPRRAPLVQVLSEGDISNPHRPGLEGRRYRRPDSDDPGDCYRLYEIAGLAHVDTRYPPSKDPASWTNSSFFAVNWPDTVRMNSLPHHRLFSMTLDHLANWVASGETPPRAERIDIGADELFAKDDYGNSRGGVRCVQLDVPKATYYANPGVDDNGLPLQGVVGIEEPLPTETLKMLYRDHHDYVERFNRRLDELIAQRWLLIEDADEMRAEAEQADVP